MSRANIVYIVGVDGELNIFIFLRFVDTVFDWKWFLCFSEFVIIYAFDLVTFYFLL